MCGINVWIICWNSWVLLISMFGEQTAGIWRGGYIRVEDEMLDLHSFVCSPTSRYLINLCPILEKHKLEVACLFGSSRGMSPVLCSHSQGYSLWVRSCLEPGFIKPAHALTLRKRERRKKKDKSRPDGVPKRTKKRELGNVEMPLPGAEPRTRWSAGRLPYLGLGSLLL